VASAILAIKILADAKQATSALSESQTKTSKWSSGLSKAAGVATVALAGVAAVAVAGVKAAADDAQQQAVLAQAMKKSAGATDKGVASMEAWISKTAFATGVADDQLRPAMGNLVRATGSAADSQKAMTLALDISAATGKDLTTVSAALAKGYSGQTTAIGRLVPGLDKAVLSSGDMAAVSDELAAKVGGSAAAAADTAAGQYQIFKVAIDETKEGIGAALLPVLGELAKHMSGISQWAANNTGVLTILLGVIAAVAAIIITVNAVTKVWTAAQQIAKAATMAWQGAQWLLNAALTANPIGLVIVAVALLVAGLVIAYNKSETFRNIVNAAFQGVLSVVKAVVAWIVDNLGPAFSKAADVAAAAIKGLGKIIGAVMDGIQSAIHAVLSVIDSIASAISNVISAISKIKVPHLPDLNPFSASAPVPGVVGASSGATFRGVARAPAVGRGTSPGSGTVININGALDPEGVARQVRRLLGAHDVRVGRAAVVGGTL
jgi:hypothetical protein